MSEERSRELSGYDTMETEELEAILRQDAEAPESAESDTELLLYIMEVLAERKKNANITGNTAQQAWESFQQNYMPHKSSSDQPGKVRKPAAPWVHRLIAAAAVIALVIIIPVTARAFSLGKLWDVIAKWAKETFSFVSGWDTNISEPVANDDLEYTSLQELLERYDRSSDMVPTKIPDGFVLERIEQDITPIQEVYRAFYINDARELIIRIQSYLYNHPEKVEVNEELIEVYTVGGMEFYIFSNYDQLRAVWITDTYECNISGDLSIDEIKEMIDSIQKG